MDSLPIVPFGKYKGQPITSLINDTKYLEWCKLQDWFQKFPVVYNICVNQTITTNDTSSKTPEHNKIQNLFLEDKNCIKLIRASHKFRKYEDICDCGGRAEFEAKFNWDFIICNVELYSCQCDWDCERERCDCEISKHKDRQDCWTPITYCEIKTSLGDDYPCVLRKMKTQILLTEANNKISIKNEIEKLQKQRQDGHCVDRHEIRGLESRSMNVYNCEYFSIFILLVKNYESKNTSREQLVSIFGQSYIKVIFLDDLFKNISVPEEKKIKDAIHDVVPIVNTIKNYFKRI